ncbi:MAG: fructosamine kinase family protein [Zetaproteobacteria bacterium]|nr:MAG: fructosamine kinase family protein [Zetaproteobacteria bacterium]
MWHRIEQDISESTYKKFTIEHKVSVGGGSINSTYRIEGSGQRYFVKTNAAECLNMFAAEANGLIALADTKAVRVPRPVCRGVANTHAYLVMEFIAFGGGSSPYALGEQLAAMHRHTQPEFGWYCDNTIGSTPQINTLSDDWISFFREHRFGFQLKLAAHNGYGGALQRKGERLMSDLGVFFEDYSPQASLLHGDLWGGNHAVDMDGHPVIYDPAVYYGDREADIAMTELFGGFGSAFYAAYHEAWPLDEGYAVRKTLYNLYHILNHANLFGGGYASQAESMIDCLLSELR